MKFILVSHRGADVPEDQREGNLKAWLDRMGMLNAELTVQVGGGKTVSSTGVRDYKGDVGGASILEAESLEEAVEIAKRSPGLPHGWTFDVLRG